MNTNIIEIIGPPGIGKSTIYKSLCKNWNSQANWIYPGLISPRAKPSISSPALWMEYQVRRIIKKHGNSLRVDDGLEFADTNKDLSEFLWERLSFSDAFGPEDAGKKLRSAYFLFRDFCRYQAIKNAKGEKPCIIDEGLLVKSFFVLPDKAAMSELVVKYIPLLNLPLAVVFVNTDHPEAIVDRLLARKKVIASHKGKDRAALREDVMKWQYLFSLIVDELKKAGTPVFQMDGLEPVNDNVDMLNDFLNSRTWDI